MAFRKGVFAHELSKAAGAGGVLSLANPEGEDLIITRLVVRLTGAGPGAATADAGIAANGSTSADNLIDGFSIAATGIFDNTVGGGTNGKGAQVWGASQYLTISASADPSASSLAGMVYVDYEHA